MRYVSSKVPASALDATCRGLSNARFFVLHADGHSRGRRAGSHQMDGLQDAASMAAVTRSQK